MATKIEWTDETWNPIIGCSKCSPGCDHCYAERMAVRQTKMRPEPNNPYHAVVTNGEWNGKTVWAEFAQSRLWKPARWRKPRRVFVCSMSDLFHPSTPDGWIDRVFATAAACPQHTFQILTKRPERMAQYMRGGADERVWQLTYQCTGKVRADWPLKNVWLGVTAETQEMLVARLPWLVRMPAAVRFLSLEPMLGPINLREEHGTIGDDGSIVLEQAFGDPRELWACRRCQGARYAETDPQAIWCGACNGTGVGINWVIVGGETGPHARPMPGPFVRGVRDQCAAAGVPFFFKQWGTALGGGSDIDGREWREFPTGDADQP